LGQVYSDEFTAKPATSWQQKYLTDENAIKIKIKITMLHRRDYETGNCGNY